MMWLADDDELLKNDRDADIGGGDVLLGANAMILEGVYIIDYCVLTAEKRWAKMPSLFSIWSSRWMCKNQGARALQQWVIDRTMPMKPK